MINYYQPFLKPFLRGNFYLLPTGIKQLYYHSWEDALWELLRQKNIPKGAVLLFPNFYCMDVLENVKKHGYKWELYDLDEHFQITEGIFIQSIEKYQPSIVVIFHACGIASKLLQETDWISKISPDTVIIEDCVHRLVNPEEITLLNNTHLVMDSLRKVSPLPGSCIYGTSQNLNYDVQHSSTIPFYQMLSQLLFSLFRVTLLTAHYINSASLATFAHTKILKAHDDIIGNSWQSYAGNNYFLRQHKHIDFAKVENHKTQQAVHYNQLFDELYINSSLFYKITIPETDYGKLHVFPLGIKNSNTTELITYLQSKNISVWCKFTDCPWSQDKAVLFLPLGFHITKNDIQYIFTTIKEFLDLAL